MSYQVFANEDQDIVDEYEGIAQNAENFSSSFFQNDSNFCEEYVVEQAYKPLFEEGYYDEIYECLCMNTPSGWDHYCYERSVLGIYPVEDVKIFEQFDASKDIATASISVKKKKNTDNRWTNRTDKQGFSHPWLLTSLKGHTGQVLDMDFASNGKYLASCADEEADQGCDVGILADTGGTSSGSECNKENNRPSSVDACCNPRVKPLSRRQRKNRRREDSSSPDFKKKSKSKKANASSVPTVSTSSAEKKPNSEAGSKKNPDVQTQYGKLAGLGEDDLFRFLRAYLLSPEQMLMMGYPVECRNHLGRAVIFKSPIDLPSYRRSDYKHNKPESKTGFDVNAREFVPNIYRKQETASGNTSEQDSGNSTDSGEIDSEESSDASSSSSEKSITRTYQQVLVNGPERNATGYSHPIPVYERMEAVCFARMVASLGICQKTCVRCGIDFYMNHDNTYITQDMCAYHWGKLTKVLLGDRSNSYEISIEYTCCRGKQHSPGCTKGKLHVWSGLVDGFNGPFDHFVKTRPRKVPLCPPGVYALDCEMCFTGHGLELTKITVVSASGKIVYDAYVKPENEIVDYNSRFSGVTAKDFQKKRALKTLKEVQNDLMGFVNADTILIGHGLENDLRALRLIHPTVIDTALAFPHYNGLPYRRSLKSLISCFLKREIQTGSNGHNSFEDAKACMDLMLWRVRKDFRCILDHSYQF